MQQWKRALDTDAGKHQRPARALEPDAPERERASPVKMQQSAREQQHAGTELDHDVAHAGAVRPLGAARPDQEHRGDRRELPPHEQRQEVAREHRPQRGAPVDQRGDMLGRILHVQRKDRREEERENEHVAEEQAQPVDPHQRERLPEQLDPSEFPVGEQQQPDEHGDWQRQQVRSPQPPPDERHEGGSENRQQRDRNVSAHSNPRIA